MATIQFIGAAQEVTGSCHKLTSPQFGTLLLDCGMHQGGRVSDRVEQETFPFAPGSVDAVILSHAHLDHSGALPRLVHEGFDGRILCTEATADLLKIMLFDAFHIYEHDLERENLRRARRGDAPEEMSYRKRDVEKTLELIEPVPYGEKYALNPATHLTFHDAGHILGSAIVELTVQERGQQKTLVFSGDLGNRNTVLMNDPAELDSAQVVLMEGTYGDRDHKPVEDTFEQLKSILHDTWERGGNVLIPAFAVGRTQEILIYLGKLLHADELDPWQIFLDSPMAIAVTKVYDKWMTSLDCEGMKKLGSGEQTLLKNFLPHLRCSVTPQDSMAINRIKRGAIVIAGSGMCTGGRIRHHFKQRIWDERNTVIFAGFQARGTLGRILVDGATRIKLFGDEFAVKANIETLGGFSAHAGQRELVEWISRFRTNPGVYLVHGEADALDTLADKLWADEEIQAIAPSPGQTVSY